MENTAIQLNKNKDIVYSSFTLHKNGLTPIGNPTFEQWAACGLMLSRYYKSIHFVIGDWLNYGEQKWGEMYAQAIDQTMFDYQTLANDKYVTSKIPVSLRRENLSFTHHALVAKLSQKEQEQLLEKADMEKLNTKEFREAVKIVDGSWETIQPRPKFKIDYCEEHEKWYWVPDKPEEWEMPHE